jgi:ribonuclease P protein component
VRLCGGGLRLQRLTSRPDFLAAAAGRRFHTERMSVQGLRRADSSGLRVGFTLTKRVGHATERNRIRRRLRAAVLEASRPFAAEPVDVVVIGRREAFAAGYPLLVADLARALATVIKQKPARARPSPPPDAAPAGGAGPEPSHA